MATQYSILQLMNTSGATVAFTGSVVDVTPSVIIAKRSMKVICAASGLTYATAGSTSFPIILEECATTNGTFTTVAGDTPPTWGTAATTGTYSEIHIQPKYRYLRARLGTVGAGGTSANLSVFAINEKRWA